MFDIAAASKSQTIELIRAAQEMSGVAIRAYSTLDRNKTADLRETLSQLLHDGGLVIQDDGNVVALETAEEQLPIVQDGMVTDFDIQEYVASYKEAAVRQEAYEGPMESSEEQVPVVQSASKQDGHSIPTKPTTKKPAKSPKAECSQDGIIHMCCDAKGALYGPSNHPFHVGSIRHGMMKTVKEGMTTSEAKALGIRADYLKFLVGAGIVTVEKVAKEKK